MDKIGLYEIIKQIGEGGMGKVLLAFDPVCQRQIAIKLIKEELAKKNAVKNRFLKEVHITSFLTHSSIIPIYTISRDKEIIYYTMPYIEGQKPKTLPDKITGTVSYMAPERAMGENASFQTEIYSLGVLLYRILTLKLPFRRKDIQHYRKIMGGEKLIDPIEATPYREIPKQLCAIVKKCLERVQNLLMIYKVYFQKS